MALFRLLHRMARSRRFVGATPSLRGARAATVIWPNNKTIAVLPNAPADMPVSRCKFWVIRGLRGSVFGFDQPGGMDKADGFRHDRMDQARDLSPAGRITEKVERFQWHSPIP